MNTLILLVLTGSLNLTTTLATPAPSWLDPAEVSALTVGSGFGMARAAEAHGLPGPKHVLEFADALELDAEQRAQMQVLMARMKADALVIGAEVLAGESALDAELAKVQPDPTAVATLSESIGLARARLRHVHLRTHIAAAPILTADQRARYRTLRAGH